MLAVRGESYKVEVYKRKENSDYEYEDHATFIFKGKPANNMEKRLYRVMKGIDGNNSSQYVFATNLPTQIEIKDKIKFLGKYWVVQGIGYYFDATLLVNAGIMSDDYMMKRCPKGLILE